MNLVRTPLTIIAALSIFAAACGGSDGTAEEATTDITNDADASPTTVAQSDESEAQEAVEAAEEPEASEQWARVTLSTGEVFELTPTSCETQLTDPNDLLNNDFVDLFARNDDGYRFSVLNATMTGLDPAPNLVELSGKHDENGVNPKISYIPESGVIEATTVTIDGRRITGESTMNARFSPEKPFGEEVVANFEFNC